MYASNSAAQVSTSLNDRHDAQLLAQAANLRLVGVPEVAELAIGEAVLLRFQQQFAVAVGCRESVRHGLTAARSSSATISRMLCRNQRIDLRAADGCPRASCPP